MRRLPQQMHQVQAIPEPVLHDQDSNVWARGLQNRCIPDAKILAYNSPKIPVNPKPDISKNLSPNSLEGFHTEPQAGRRKFV